MNQVRFLHRLLLLVAGLCCCNLQAQPLPELIPYKAATGWGYSDSNKVIKVPCIYRSASLFYNGKGRVTIERDGEVVHCLIDRNGKFIIGPELHWNGLTKMDNRSIGLNVHSAEGRWGRVDTAGRLVIPMLYDKPAEGYVYNEYEIEQSAPHLLRVSSRGMFGLVDTVGSVVVPCSYEKLEPAIVKNERTLQGWLVRKEQKWGLLSPDGREVFSCHYDSVATASWAYGKRNGVAIQNDGLWGWYTIATGEEIAPRFKQPPSGAGSYVAAWDTAIGGAILLSTKGERLSAEKYSHLELYPDSVVAVRYENSDRGLLQFSGKFDLEKDTVLHWRLEPDLQNILVSGPEYEYDLSVEPFVMYNRKRIYVFDTGGRNWWVSAAIVPRWEDPHPRSAPYMAVASPGDSLHPTLYGVIDTNLRFVVAPRPDFEFLGGDWSRSYLIVRPVVPGAAMCGVVDMKFRWIVRPQTRLIGSYFRWKGKAYLLGSYQEKVPVYSLPLRKEVVRSSRSVEDYQHLNDPGRARMLQRYPAKMTLLDQQGRILPGFDSIREPTFFSYNKERLAEPQSDIIQVVPFSDWGIGFLTLKGEIVYPKIHYKYSNILFLGRQIIIGRELHGNNYRVVNTEDKSLTPALEGRIRAVGFGELLYPDLGLLPPPGWKGLAVIHYAAMTEWNSKATASVLLDLHGTIYAEADAIR